MRKLLMAILSATFLFAGCGVSNTTTPSSRPPQDKVAEAPAQPEPQKLEWNTNDLNPMSNGNMAYAFKLVQEYNGDLANAAIVADAADVMKRPWDYYGKIISFSGEAALLQDYPPGDNLSKAFGSEACEIVISNGTVIIDGILRGNTKDIYEGDWVTFYGYPCGIMEVDNKIGGKFNHLIVVGTR